MKSFKKQLLVLTCTSLLALPAAFAKDVDDKFQKMDVDGDGQISRTEHAAGARQMFLKMDGNSDGVVTAAEMAVKKDSKVDSSAQGTSSPRGNVKADELSASEKIKMIDQNNDGQLTQAEHTAGSEKMFAQMDTNNDGSLSQSELEAGHKMLKKHK